MKILHIFDTCGAGSELMDYCIETGNCSRVITTRAHDKFSHSRGLVVPGSKSITALGFILSPVFDAIVLHGNLSLVKYLKPINNNLFLYAHGTEIRGRWEERRGVLKHIKHVFVSTPDLLEGAPPGFATYLPVIINREFYEVAMSKISPLRALSFTYNADEEARELVRPYGIPLDILPRTLKHAELPYLFLNYTHYVDFKRDHLGRSLIDPDKGVFSLTGLEALAQGLSLITEKGIISKAPPDNRKSTGELFLKVLKEYVPDAF